MALGVLDNVSYEQEKIMLEPGAVVVVYSDGITDATNTSDEAFGEERLSSLIERHRDASSARLVEVIVGAVAAHAGESPQLDDLTVVAIKRTS